jgi:glycosyltransferase involved in cell wall biosynthesis
MRAKRKQRDIVWVAQGIEGYGVLAAVFGLAGEVRAQGDRVRILALGEGPIMAYAREHGFECICLNQSRPLKIQAGKLGRVWSLVRSCWQMIGHTFRIARWLSRNKPDYIHIVPNILAVPGVLAGKLSGVHPIWEMSNAVGDKYPLHLNKRLYQLACKFSGATVLANSHYSGTTVAGWGVCPITFHLGVSSARFNPNEVDSVERAEIGLNESDCVFGIFARLVEEKGHMVLIEAIARLAPEFPELKVLMLGGPLDSVYAKRLKQRIEALGISEQVCMLGPQSQVERYYGIVDVGLNFRIDPEPFGLSVIESMLMQTPVLAHAAGGPGETILDGRTGWLLPSLESEVVCAGIRRVLADRGMISKMGADARVHALENFSTAAQFLRYDKILIDIDE